MISYQVEQLGRPLAQALRDAPVSGIAPPRTLARADAALNDLRAGRVRGRVLLVP